MDLVLHDADQDIGDVDDVTAGRYDDNASTWTKNKDGSWGVSSKQKTPTVSLEALRDDIAALQQALVDASKVHLLSLGVPAPPAAPSVTAASWNDITDFTRVKYDSGTGLTHSNGVITIDQEGMYRVAAKVYWPGAQTTDWARRLCRILVNDETVTRDEDGALVTTSASTRLVSNTDCLVQLSATDEVKIAVYSTEAVTMQNTANEWPTWTFDVLKVGEL